MSGDVLLPDRLTATPQEIMEFLRKHIAGDRLLAFQQSIGNAAVHQAAGELHGRAIDKNLAAEWDHNPDKQIESEAFTEAAEEIDPAKGAGPYPSKLLCFRHGGDGSAPVRPCPGSPWCNPAR